MFSTIIDILTSEEFIKAAFFPGITLVMLYALFTVWYERKLLARVALRIGPLHVGKIAGVFQLVADAVKLLTKEVIVPSKAYKILFVISPIIGGFLPLLIFPFIPFGSSWIIYPSNVSLLIVFAIIAVSPIPFLVAAWASRSKYPFIGMLRFGFQLFAYEVPLFLALIPVVILTGSLDLQEIVTAQKNFPFILILPLSFIVFLISSIAEVERIPFDIPTAEQELVAGWTTEYSGVLLEFIQLGAYLKADALAVITSILFLGGWLGPDIPFIPLEIEEPFWLMLKSLIVLSFILFLRGVYPRITIDRLLDLGWRTLIPLALLNIFIAAIIVVYIF
ncbi:MAG: NADH-quinone oxidoreductase subunit NuoH [Aigarchaeota archaeon]|nr:NADH-quinone oxidoreductase subunit NuoH [Aigarchaeota archaeon]MCX8192254.1 NADH-quinone oxidoreductase subunit NuoH [Nitrososphaeria archaeon]MDW7986138.1 NADH-quinone oxidoreductase subunit NuoH [Nitrososphaerota archaeon]